MLDRAVGEDRDVRGAAADVDQADAEVALVVEEHGVGGGERLQHEVAHLEPAAAHALHDVLRRRHGAGDDVHLDLEAHAAHAQRLAHAALAVDHELLLEDVQDLLLHRDVDRARRLDHAVDVVLLDLLVLDRHHAVRVEALDVAAGDARDHLADLGVRHELRLLERALDGVDGRFDVDHHALLQAARRVAAHADEVERVLGRDLGDQGHDLRGTDIEGDEEVAVVARARGDHLGVGFPRCRANPLA